MENCRHYKCCRGFCRCWGKLNHCTKNANKLNNFVETLNREYEAAYKEALKKYEKFSDSTILRNVQYEVLVKDKYKKSWYELSQLFSADLNTFKNVNKTSKILQSAGIGAVLGTVGALCIGIFEPVLKARNADKQITKEFIENHK